MQLLGTHHIAIFTADLPRLERFYAETLGCPATLRWDDQGIVFVDIGSTQLELIGREAEAGEPGPREVGKGKGINHIALHVADADATYEELMGKGVEGLSGPRDFESVRIAFLADPDGNVLELVQER